MFLCPYSTPYGFPGIRPAKAYIRVLHASPDAPPVDVYANGGLIARDLAYKGFTEYLSVNPGEYNVKIYPAGTNTRPVLDTNVTIQAQTIATVAAVGMLADISLQVIPEPVIPIPPGQLYIRFVHLSPDAPNVDITLPDGTILFKNVAYRQVTGYIPVNPMTYTLEARIAGTDRVVLYVPNIRLTANRFYSVYAVGLVKGTPPLQVLIPLDGNSYLKV